MPIKYKLLRKTELDFEISIRGGTPRENVELNRSLMRELLEIEADTSFPYMPENEKDILNSIIRIKTDIKAIKTNSEPVNPAIFNENFNSINRRFEITTDMPVYLAEFWDSIKESWESFNKITTQTVQQSTSNLTNSSENSVLNSVNNKDSNITVTSQNILSNNQTVTTDLIYSNDTIVKNNQSCTLENPTDTHNSRPVDISKLRLSYDGKSCVFEFLERVEELAVSRSISESALLRGLPELLSGNALQFYRQSKGSFHSWYEFRQILKDKYQPEDYQFRLSKDIYVRTQGKQETVSDYFATMDTLFGRLARPMSEGQKLDILLRNVRPVYSNQLGLLEPDSVHKLQTFCERLERNHSRSKFFSETPADFLSTSTRPVTSVERPNVSVGREIPGTHNSKISQQPSRIYAVRTFGQRRSCLRCDTTDHSGFRCPRSKEILCFRCKAPGQKMPTCTNCKAKEETKELTNQKYKSKNEE